MIDEDVDMEDIENVIPINKITLSTNSEVIKITKTKLLNGFQVSNIDLINLISTQRKSANSYNNNNNNNNVNILPVVCLSIEDLKSNLFHDTERGCWKFCNIIFRNVLIYGRIVILKESIKNNRSFYIVNIDDETETITGYLNKFQPNSNVAKIGNNINNVKSTLERRKETGINLSGTFYHADSEECKKIISDLKCLQHMTEKNLDCNKKDFKLGVVEEKSLVYARPYLTTERTTKLQILDLTFCDEIELSWKRNLNTLYSELYFK